MIKFWYVYTAYLGNKPVKFNQFTFVFHLTLILPLEPEPFPLLVCVRCRYWIIFHNRFWNPWFACISFTSSLITGIMVLMGINYCVDWPLTLIKLLNTTLSRKTKLVKLMPMSTKSLVWVFICSTNCIFLKPGTFFLCWREPVSHQLSGKVSPFHVEL